MKTTDHDRRETTMNSTISGLMTFAILFGLTWMAGLAVPAFPVAAIAGGVVAILGRDEE